MRFGVGVNDTRVPSGLMGKSSFAAKFEASVRNPVLERALCFAKKVLLSDRVLNILAKNLSHPLSRVARGVVDVLGTRLDRRLTPDPVGLRGALFGRKNEAGYRSALAGLLLEVLKKYVLDWKSRQEAGRAVPPHRRVVTPPPKTYLGWKRLRDELQPGWKMVPRDSDVVRVLPTDQMDPRERIERLIRGEEVDRVGFGPNWDFAVCYLGGSNIWEFCYDGIATGLASVNTHLRVGGSDFLPVAFGVGAYAVPFPDIHSRFFYGYSLPHDAGFPQFLETGVLRSLDDLLERGLTAQLQEVTKRTMQDFLAMLREVVYDQVVVKRYFGPVWDRYFPYAEGMISALDLLPMARGVGKFAYDCRKWPEKVDEAFQFYGKPLVDLMVRVSKAIGARSVLVGCSRGSNTFMSVEKFEETHWPTLKYAIEETIKAGMVPTCHFDNDWTQTMEFLAEKLPKRSCLFHLDQVDLVEVHDRIGDHFCLMGGVDPGTVALASPSKLQRVLERYIEAIGEDGLILASGCEIPVDVPIENLYAYKRAILARGVFRR
ncbi:MAG: uroporphyrinogen decarboxylase family protein [Promethearchaeota archaeon]